MTLAKLFGLLVALAGIGVLAVALAPMAASPFDSHLFAQDKQGRMRDLSVLAGRGADIGVFVRDAEAGVTVDEVRTDSVAEKAGLKRSDVIVTFDGERVRSARQFSRLVQETPSGRTVTATVLRDAKQTDIRITIPEGRRADLLSDFADRLPPFNFNFDFDVPEIVSGRRLGITVEKLSEQLAEYFGAKAGVLVTAVADGSPAARAGLRAGDVITSIDGQGVHTREELATRVQDAPSDQIEIGIVREKKATTVKATVEPVRHRTSRGARL